MCFQTCRISKRKEGVGWKIFVQDNGNLYSTRCAPDKEQDIIRPENKWLTATRYKGFEIRGKDSRMSPHWTFSGWMIFKHEKDAVLIRDNCEVGNVVRKVRWRNADFDGVVAWIGGDRTPVIQTREMKILPA